MKGYGHQPVGKTPAKSARSSNIGFVVAGVCVMSAALILMFVYFMAMGLSSNTPAGVVGTSYAPTVTSSLSPTPAASLTSTPTASATKADLPGEQFISEAETATAVDTTTSKALDPVTTFSVNQKVYITFHLHPAGQAGAVCLLWYLNGKETAQFEFSVSPADEAAYSYAIFRQAGAGYVDIFWASTTACTDKLLAQHVVFDVTSG